MTPGLALRHIIDPNLRALAELGAPCPISDSARTMLLAIAMQESGLAHRRQVRGPARGWLQFEAGGVAGVLAHVACRPWLRVALDAWLLPTTAFALHATLEWSDTAAVWLARALLWADPAPLPPPSPESVGISYSYYIRLWRPGRPHPEAWPGHWERACRAVADNPGSVRLPVLVPKEAIP